MGIPAEFAAMARATDSWLRTAIPSKTYLGWLAVADDGAIAAGGRLIVIPWPPGSMTMDAPTLSAVMPPRGRILAGT